MNLQTASSLPELETIAMLIIFSGLPGTGKTTIARELARKTGAVYLRIDTIEDLLSNSPWVDVGEEMGPIGYDVAIAVARDNLAAGNPVITDSVNPLTLSRQAYHQAARVSCSGWLDVHVTCSDVTEHRRRVENRRLASPGERLPDWEKVQRRDFHPWQVDPSAPFLELDTAALTRDACVAAIVERLDALGASIKSSK